MINTDYELVEAYRKISPKYTNIKKKPWRDFKFYMDFIKKNFSLPTSGILLDIGAGNCRNLLFFENQKWEHIASDISLDLLKNAVMTKNNHIYKINHDMKSFPLRNYFIDMVICIAVFHHLRSNKEVLKVLQNINKVLKANKYLIISCWRRWKKGSRKMMLKDLLLYPYKKLKDKMWRYGDIYLDWFDNNKEVVAKRYYHLFTKRELAKIVKKGGFEVLNCEKLGGVGGRDNIFLLLRNLA